MDARCAKCGKSPEEITEYVIASIEEDMTPSDYVKSEEGTYNPKNGHFYCTSCYVRLGMPLGKAK